MGLWNFVKNAGKSLFGGDDAQPSAESLRAEVEELGLDATGLDITVEGDKVSIAGDAVDAETREKIILAVGNVEGIAAVEDNAKNAPEPVFHTVAKGDTLWAISSKTLGSGARYMEIFEANRPMLSDPDKIYPGQMLRIPQG
ncbi:MAG: peptidoglycan-binding protein LysM [Rubricella sp.]